MLYVTRREPTCIPADPAPVSAHETGHPAEPGSATSSPPTTRQRESSTSTGNTLRIVQATSAGYNARSCSPKLFILPDLDTVTSTYLCLFTQQISQHQELFIQMLNEPVGEGGEAPEVGELGAAGEEGAPVNYIQVTPQEKEAIERVSDK